MVASPRGLVRGWPPIGLGPPPVELKGAVVAARARPRPTYCPPRLGSPSSSSASPMKRKEKFLSFEDFYCEEGQKE